MNGMETEQININAKHDSESGEYERHFQIKPGHLVLDLGAHAGHFSEWVCNKGAMVIAFEPHPTNFKWLNERLKGKNAIAINKAAWNATGIRTLFECPANTGANSLFKHSLCSDVEYAVGCIDIGEFLKAAHIVPDFIKVDTESSEYNILESLIRAGINTNMAIECHDRWLYDRCRSLAESWGMKWMPKDTHVGVCYCFPRH